MSNLKVMAIMVNFGKIRHFLCLTLLTAGFFLVSTSYASASVDCVATPDDPGCINVSHTIYCENTPNDPICIGYNTACVDSDPHCNGLTSFCSNDPSNGACVGYNTICSNDPNAPNCSNMIATCANDPTQALCVGYSSYCSQNSGFVVCTGYASFCPSNNTNPYCVGFTNFCDANSTDPTCIGSDLNAYCTSPGHANDVSCIPGAFCINGNCTAPANLKISCSADATKATLSWDPMPGATSYQLNVDYSANNGGVGCVESWACDGRDSSNVTSGSSYVITGIVPNSPYNSTVLGIVNGVSTGANDQHFTCNVALPGSPEFCADPANTYNVNCIPGTDAYCTNGYHTGSSDCNNTSYDYCRWHATDPACIPAGCTPMAMPSTATKTFDSPSAGDGSIDLTIPLIGTVDSSSPWIDVLHIYQNGTEVFTGSFGYPSSTIFYNPNSASASSGISGNANVLSIHLPLVGLAAGNNTVSYTYDSPTTWNGVPQSGPEGVASEGWCVTAQEVTTPTGICVTNPADISCPGAPAYCSDPAHPEHLAEDVCIVGKPDYCNSGYHPNDVNCPGSDAFCQMNPTDVSCPGSALFCQAHPTDVSCPGSVDYCNANPNDTTNCGAGSDFCNTGVDDARCPGTESYCTKYPYDPLCGVVNIPPTPGPLPYSVLETSKSSGLGTVLCSMVYYMKSGIGFALALISIIALAASAMFDKISWGHAIAVGVGIATIGGASIISTSIGSNVSGIIPGATSEAITACLQGDG